MVELSLREGIVSKGRDAFIAHLHDDAPLFEDVRAILLDYERFSSSAMTGGGLGFGFPLLTDDPPRHSVLRALLAKAFTPAAMEAMRPSINALAKDLAAAIPFNVEIDIVEKMTT